MMNKRGVFEVLAQVLSLLLPQVKEAAAVLAVSAGSQRRTTLASDLLALAAVAAPYAPLPV